MANLEQIVSQKAENDTRWKAQQQSERENTVAILTQNVRMGLNGKKHRRNLLQIVIGGSGAGKTRFFCKPSASVRAE